jgi:hypothetical protein
MTKRSNPEEELPTARLLRIVKNSIGDPLMKATLFSTLYALLAVLVLAGVSAAKELPNAPSAEAAEAGFYTESTSAAAALAPRFVEKKNPIDRKFVSLAIVSTGSTFADSYTTLWARDNWLAGRKGVCNMEVESAYLYGVHPTVGRAYAVASVKSATTLFAAYYLRKHHSKLWSLPLMANSAISLQGVTQNMIECQ